MDSQRDLTWSIKSAANKRQKKLRPAVSPVSLSPCWHSCYFPGEGLELLHSFPQQLFSWNSAEYFFLFLQQKSM